MPTWLRIAPLCVRALALATLTILRTEIDRVAATGKSVMPEGLEEGLEPRDFADVSAFLHSARQP